MKDTPQPPTCSNQLNVLSSTERSFHLSYKVLLVSTYEVGHQPFGLASPAAWLAKTGAHVRCVDLSREKFRTADFEEADFIGFYMHMHTATRLAGQLIPKVVQLNTRAHLCAYGLYAPMNEQFLRSLGIISIIGGEFEAELAKLVTRVMGDRSSAERFSTVSLGKQQFLVPDRTSLPGLSEYSRLNLTDGTQKVVGYTEASRGCKHLCRHCPIVPVYNGNFRIVQRQIVLEDIRRQVQTGAQHITFGDPDFFNGIGHAVALVRSLHEEFPNLTYDVTIKVEHLIRHGEYLSTLKETGCAFVTSAVESVDDRILCILEKGHTREDFIGVISLFRSIDLPLAPTFVSFTPWLALEGYEEMLRLIAELEITGWVAPVQWAIRLLIPNGSRVLELPEVRKVITGFDTALLSHRWLHPDPRMDELQRGVEMLVKRSAKLGLSREQIFERVWRLVQEMKGGAPESLPHIPILASRCTIPYLTEPWYC